MVMASPRRRRITRSHTVRTRAARLRAALLAAVCVGALLPLVHQETASALVDPTGPVTGNATWFTGLGGPYGGCGMTQDALETQNFIALNVYDTPGDYTYYTRPMPNGDPKIGMWNNGHNCGRWVQVTIGDYCTGVNDGAPNQPFCKNGGWITDEYNGATLNMIVADSCGDGNAWCRDDPYHIDLAKASLNRFVKDGAEVGDMDPDHWNNRHVSWEFIPAPDYSGDIQIGFLNGAQTWWPAIAVSHLANGIHGVESWSDGAWVDATMDGDMGQAFIIKPYEPGGTRFSIRVRDAGDEYVNGGRVYTFDLPAGCDPQCSSAYQAIDYTTSTAPPTEAPGDPSAGTCTASGRAVNSWPGGYQAEVTVAAESRIRGWSVSFTPAGDQTIGDVWNGVRANEGSTVTVRNASWNGALAAGASTTFGFIVNGGATVPEMTCTAA